MKLLTFFWFVLLLHLNTLIHIKSIRDIWTKNIKKSKGLLSSFIDPKSAAYVKYFLSWVSIIKSIPIAWTLLLEDDDCLVNSELNMENSILCFSGEMLKLTEMTSKIILLFTIYCESDTLQSKGEIKFNNLMENDYEMKDACNLLYLVSIDTYIRDLFNIKSYIIYKLNKPYL